MLLEMTARDSLVPLPDAGYYSVGTEVNVRHLAATPLGMQVRFEREVIAGS
jgi:fluoroacetyl-CoA thioesterase